MAESVSEFVIERMKERGVSRVLGFPGDGIGEMDGMLGKTDRESTGVDSIRPTHEEICAQMATAHAKFTGEAGVRIAASGPGAFHLINGLYDGKSDNVSVVAIVGQQACRRSARSRSRRTTSSGRSQMSPAGCRRS